MSNTYFDDNDSCSSSNSSSQYEDVFTCFICLGLLKKPVLCPKCSKLCCERCIKKWIIENKKECPHCRARLMIEDLVPCRFIDEWKTYIKTILNEKKKKKEKSLCPYHNATINYICSTCKIPICSDCALFDKHKGHSFIHLSDVCDSLRIKIGKHNDYLNKHLHSLEDLLECTNKQIEFTKKSKYEIELLMDSIVQEAKQQLDLQMLSKIEKFKENKNKIITEIKNVNTSIEQVHHEIKKSNSYDFYQNSENIINTQLKKHPQNFNYNLYEPISIEFNNNLIPEFESSIFTIKNFTQVQKIKNIVYSDEVFLSFVKWRFKVYPNGNGRAKGKYLSVFIEMIQGSTEVSDYQYKIELINKRKDGKNNNIIRKYTSQFKESDCWGYEKFNNLDSLRNDGFIDEDDTLELLFSVRQLSYKQKCDDIILYLKNNEKHNNNEELCSIEDSEDKFSITESLTDEIEDKENSDTFNQNNTFSSTILLKKSESDSSYLSKNTNLTNSIQYTQDTPSSSMQINKNQSNINCSNDVNITTIYQNDEFETNKSRIEKLDDIKKTLDEIKINIKGKSRIDESDHDNYNLNYISSLDNIKNNEDTINTLEETNETKYKKFHSPKSIISEKNYDYSISSKLCKAIGNRYEKDVNKIIEDFGYNSFNNIFDSNNYNKEETFIDHSRITEKEDDIQLSNCNKLNNSTTIYNNISEINGDFDTNNNYSNKRIVADNDNNNYQNSYKNSHSISDINLNFSLNSNEVFTLENDDEEFKYELFSDNRMIFNRNNKKNHNNYTNSNSCYSNQNQYRLPQNASEEIFSQNHIRNDQTIIDGIKSFVENKENNDLKDASFTSINEFFNHCDNEILKNNYLASPFKNIDNIQTKDINIHNTDKSLSYEHISFVSPNIAFNKKDDNTRSGMFNNYYITNNVSSSNNYMNMLDSSSNKQSNNNQNNSLSSSNNSILSFSENSNASKKSIIKELLNKINSDIKNKK
ncbi:hypothetical protein BCR36DRAFT_416256 [Piromyces finnis]|uniref:RING-type domain-containing protein n=1 Tax=Piromyces finnis TaxID=1754191 RepID=A0A1Y1UVN8_9FUNG|nr:hypothetical protein BCR36DRAFT_416256 [Piromyces finnis]|eukprot:ORX42126.1 hypothetical protein BCR36DRAFT_416256 [Piromyces finnis]